LVHVSSFNPFFLQGASSSSSSSSSLSADEIVNTWEVGAIFKVLKEYGEEPRAYKLARAIVSARPLTSTGQLKEVIERHTPYAGN